MNLRRELFPEILSTTKKLICDREEYENLIVYLSKQVTIVPT
jgi:hypothetical protein